MGDMLQSCGWVDWNDGKSTAREEKVIECHMSPEMAAKVSELFDKMDSDRSNGITKEEAMSFFKSKLTKKFSADAMFKEMDDGDGKVTKEEFMSFWQNVKDSGYDEEDIICEMDMLQSCGWV